MNLPTQLVDESVRQGQKFLLAFFKQLDKRQNLEMITPQTAIVWNGTPIAGDQAFAQMLAAMPSTRHDITGFNLHPLPSGDAKLITVIIDASGKVVLDPASEPFGFSSQIVARRTHVSDQLRIQTFAYRIVAKSDGASLAC